MSRAGVVSAAFRTRFGTRPTLVAKAPGRVNLIGEHTDYNNGLVLPCAINYATWVAASMHENSIIEAHALDLDDSDAFRLDEPILRSPDKPWSNYLRGVCSEMQQAGFSVPGARLVISGDVPQGAGLSSSASLEMAILQALTALAGTDPGLVARARIGQMAEHHFAGCACGIMDQLVSVAGIAGHAIAIDCRSLDTTPIPVPAALGLLIIESGVQRGLVDSEYNLRRSQCEAAAAHFGKASLRDVTLPMLLEAGEKLPAGSFARARHVIEENDRVRLAMSALSAGDFSSLGRVMAESHESMRSLFEITTSEIDVLVSLVQSVAGNRGGARMTGGGFGGCVVALVESSIAGEVIAEVDARYPAMTGRQHRFIRAVPSAGAGLVEADAGIDW
ncbi:MAG: galactokinase [Pseudomonadota bacterium]